MSYRLKVGSQVWVPDEVDGFHKVPIKRLDGSNCYVDHGKGKTDQKWQAADVHMANSGDFDGVTDCTSMMYLNEATLLHNLHRRYMKDDIYTYCAHILVAVNPNKMLNNTYEYSNIEAYRGKPFGQLPPHVFAMADRAYNQMRSSGKSQAMVVSGESGSGKTESCKYMIQYLGVIGSSQSERTALSLAKRLQNTNPILESFGNARTIRNQNSSRFGKFMRVQFGPLGLVEGGSIDTYLLEKSRIVMHSQLERNYHIFYALCAGSTKAELKQFQIISPRDYLYLNQGGCPPGMADKEGFTAVKESMASIDMDLKVQADVFQIVAGLIHLGNVNFEEREAASIGKVSQISGSSQYLLCASRLLGIDIATLKEKLCERAMLTPRKTTTLHIPLGKEDAQTSRDSLAKAIYGRLFNWLVEEINKNLSSKSINRETTIGVLDIFGFESLAVNSFEQLCINYTNEWLQHHFGKVIFLNEQSIYQKEGLNITPITFADNQHIIALLGNKKDGLLTALDDMTKVATATDTNFVTKIFNEHSKSKHLKKPSMKGATAATKDGFIVVHYAAAVQYTVEGFLDKNKDSLHEDLVLCAQSSSHPLIAAMFVELEDTSTRGGKRSSTPGLRIQTVANKFMKQLDELMGVLDSVQSHFVRCVRPNKEQKPKLWSGNVILHQLRCCGMVDALTMLHIGYPTRCDYSLLIDRFGTLVPERYRTLPAPKLVEVLLVGLGMEKSDFALGFAKVFFKAGKLAVMDTLSGVDWEHMAPTVEAKLTSWEKMRVKKRWKNTIIAVISLVRIFNLVGDWRLARQMVQAATRGMLDRRKYQMRVVEKKKEEEEERTREEERELKRKEEEQCKRKEEEDRKRQEEIERKQREDEEQRRKLEEEREQKEERVRKLRDETEKKKQEEVERRRKAAEEKRLAKLAEEQARKDKEVIDKRAKQEMQERVNAEKAKAKADAVAKLEAEHTAKASDYKQEVGTGATAIPAKERSLVRQPSARKQVEDIGPSSPNKDRGSSKPPLPLGPARPSGASSESRTGRASLAARHDALQINHRFAMTESHEKYYTEFMKRGCFLWEHFPNTFNCAPRRVFVRLSADSKRFHMSSSVLQVSTEASSEGHVVPSYKRSSSFNFRANQAKETLEARSKREDTSEKSPKAPIKRTFSFSNQFRKLSPRTEKKDDIKIGEKDENGDFMALALTNIKRLKFGSYCSTSKSKLPWLHFTLEYFQGCPIALEFEHDSDICSWIMGLQCVLVKLSDDHKPFSHATMGRLLWQKAKLRVAWKSQLLGFSKTDVIILAMGISPRKFKNQDGYKIVKLNKESSNTRLGIVFHKRMASNDGDNSDMGHAVRPVINLLSKDGIAAQSGNLNPGDEIISVNGHLVLSNYAACQKLREATRELELVVKLANYEQLAS